MTKTNSHQAGFSIIELVVVLMIVGFIVLTISNIPTSLKLIGNSNYESLAKEIASKKVEDIRSLPFENLAEGTTAISDTRLNKIPNGLGEVIVSSCPDAICNTQAEKDTIKQVVIKVLWVEAGSIREVKLTTLIAKGGLH